MPRTTVDRGTLALIHAFKDFAPTSTHVGIACKQNDFEKMEAMCNLPPSVLAGCKEELFSKELRDEFYPDKASRDKFFHNSRKKTALKHLRAFRDNFDSLPPVPDASVKRVQFVYPDSVPFPSTPQPPRRSTHAQRHVETAPQQRHQRQQLTDPQPWEWSAFMNQIPPHTPSNAGASKARPALIPPHTPLPAGADANHSNFEAQMGALAGIVNGLGQELGGKMGALTDNVNLMAGKMNTMADKVSTLTGTVNDQIAHQNGVNARQAQYNQSNDERYTDLAASVEAHGQFGQQLDVRFNDLETGVAAKVAAQERTNVVQRRFNYRTAHRVTKAQAALLRVEKRDADREARDADIEARMQVLEKNCGVQNRSDDEEDV